MPKTSIQESRQPRSADRNDRTLPGKFPRPSWIGRDRNTRRLLITPDGLSAAVDPPCRTSERTIAGSAAAVCSRFSAPVMHEAFDRLPSKCRGFSMAWYARQGAESESVRLARSKGRLCAVTNCSRPGKAVRKRWMYEACAVPWALTERTPVRHHVLLRWESDAPDAGFRLTRSESRTLNCTVIQSFFVGSESHVAILIATALAIEGRVMTTSGWKARRLAPLLALLPAAPAH